MLPMSNQAVAPGATETQQLRVNAPPGVSRCLGSRFRVHTHKSFGMQAQIRLRLRVAFAADGQSYQEQVDFAGFPQNLTTGGV